ncbi:MAG: 3'-5' exonuclease [Phototrophicaceae bacterium]
MPNFIPSAIQIEQQAATPGEKIVLNLFKVLPTDFIVRYEMVVSERNEKPDFVIFSPQRGICVVEVKDWSIDAIVEATPRAMVIKWNGNQPHTRKNPTYKCQVYVANIKEQLELTDNLVDSNGKLRLKVEYLVALPNMTEPEFIERSLVGVMNQKQILFRESLEDKDQFWKIIDSILPKLDRSLTSSENNTVNGFLGLRVEVPPQLEGKIVNQPDVVQETLLQREFSLDVSQEQVTKNLGSGPRLLRGLAGSGKTLILLAHTKLRATNAQASGEGFRALILCWNVSLANYMRQSFININIEFTGKLFDTVHLGSPVSSVEIMHFSEWTKSINQYLRQGKFSKFSSTSFIEDISSSLKQTTLSAPYKYDLICIDEAQDFRQEWIEFLFNNALHGEDAREKNLIISADDAQRIYKHGGNQNFSWSKLGIPMQGRSQILRRVYRNSVRVWMFAGFLLGNIGDYYREDDGSSSAKLWFAPKRGIDPQLIQCSSYAAQLSEITNTIIELSQENYTYNNILILYPKSRIGKYLLIDQLTKKLEEHKIPFDWISENADAKRSFNWSENSVKISTVQSAKGLDAPVVIVISAEAFDVQTGDQDEIDPKKLLYVALTRSREYLKVLYCQESGMVPELQKAYELYRQNYDKVLAYEDKIDK